MKSKNVVLAGLAGFLFLALSASQAAASPAEEAAQAGELSMRRLAQFQAALKPFTPAPFPGGSAACSRKAEGPAESPPRPSPSNEGRRRS